MNVRRLIVSILVVTGCARPVPPPAPPLIASTAAPAAHPSMVWTTESKADDCRAFPVGSAPPFSTFDSREACESWVKGRRCRPGFFCSDGCNTKRCSPDGDHLSTTLVSCELRFQMKFEFPRGSSVALGSAKTTMQEITPALHRVLDEPSGKIMLRGQTTAADAKTAAARTRLAEARTRSIRDMLAAEGVPPGRVETTTDPDDPAGASIVTLVGHADETHRECKEPPTP